ARWLVKHVFHELKLQLQQNLPRFSVFGMMAGSQSRELQLLERVLHHRFGSFEGIPAAPCGLDEVKSQLMACRWRVGPWSQAATSDKLTSLFLENRPVLNAVFLKASHFGMHFVPDVLLAEWTPQKSHYIGISPESLSQAEVVFFPGAE